MRGYRPFNRIGFSAGSGSRAGYCFADRIALCLPIVADQRL
jgi:hypothetical protein